MRIEDARKMLFSDTLVPDVFISEYMASLSGAAVKIYIYALHVSRHHEAVTAAELARRLDTDLDEVKAAIFELTQKGLIEHNDKKKTLIISDVKEKEVAKYYRPRTSSPPSEVIDRTSRQPERDKLIRDVNKSFFHGMMGYSWYQAIDEWFEIYHFEPEVVYALFNECASRNKLSNKSYISVVAKDWSIKGVATYQDLNRYYANREKTELVRNEIGKKLRKNMTEFDDKIVEKWVREFGYDMTIIDLALQNAVRIGQPNMNYFDAILTSWHEAKVKTVADVKLLEEEKKIKNQEARAAKQQSGQNKGPGLDGRGRYRNLGNFDQREYSEEFLESFDLDLFSDDKKIEEGESHVS